MIKVISELTPLKTIEYVMFVSSSKGNISEMQMESKQVFSVSEKPLHNRQRGQNPEAGASSIFVSVYKWWCSDRVNVLAYLCRSLYNTAVPPKKSESDLLFAAQSMNSNLSTVFSFQLFAYVAGKFHRRLRKFRKLLLFPLMAKIQTGFWL